MTAWAIGFNGGGDMESLARDCHEIGRSITGPRGEVVGTVIDIFDRECVHW